MQAGIHSRKPAIKQLAGINSGLQKAAHIFN
jgi:hypothetical protein